MLGCSTLLISPSNPVLSLLHSKRSLPLSLNTRPLPASPKQAAHFPPVEYKVQIIIFSVAIHLHFPRRYLFQHKTCFTRLSSCTVYFNPARHSGYLRYRLHVIRNSQLFLPGRLWAFILADTLTREATSVRVKAAVAGCSSCALLARFFVDGKD